MFSCVLPSSVQPSFTYVWPLALDIMSPPAAIFTNCPVTFEKHSHSWEKEHHRIFFTFLGEENLLRKTENVFRTFVYPFECVFLIYFFLSLALWSYLLKKKKCWEDASKLTLAEFLMKGKSHTFKTMLWRTYKPGEPRTVMGRGI